MLASTLPSESSFRPPAPNLGGLGALPAVWCKAYPQPLPKRRGFFDATGTDGCHNPLLQYLSQGKTTELQILHEDVPDGDDVADAAGEDEEMEDGMHVFPFVQTVEDGAGDIADAFADNPDEGCCWHTVDQGFEGYEYAEAHSDETKGLDVAVVLQFAEGDDGADDGAEPHEAEEGPAPVALFAQGCQRDG